MNKMNGKWTEENFEIHCQASPEIYTLFSRFAHLAASKRDYYSAKSIFHRIRWETMVSDGFAEFKIDDGWISHYARKFMAENPEHDGFFQTRVRANSYHKD